jgi:hypothetical protein
MTSRSLIVRALVALGLAATASAPAAIAAPVIPEHGPRPVLDERSCATPGPTSFEMRAATSAMRRYVEEGGANVTGQIAIAWHVIHDGPVGDVPQSQIEAQIAYLNASYAGTGFSFVLASVDRTDNKAWFAMIPGTGKEKQAKKNLAIDPLHYFNVYSCAPGKNLLGWATFPWMFDEGHYEHGVVLHYGSLPGGYLVPYDLGGTLAHEAGHYLGLLHTFEGGCVAPGDYCDDTPFEASPASRCPEGRDTCTEPGLDPIHNYMDYSDDSCITQFTPGQVQRMRDAWLFWRAA